MLSIRRVDLEYQAVSIIDCSRGARPIVESFRPLATSIEWELGKQYLRDRGSQAFITDPVPVPAAINNDGNSSLHAAEMIFASLVAAEVSERLESHVYVLELGVGLGLFARHFLDAFRAMCIQNGKDYYERLCYVAADRSERMLLDVSRNGVLSEHAGRYRMRVADALHPEQLLADDVNLAEHSRRPFRAMFLNYLLDCLPAAVLEVNGSDVRQLCVRTCLARGIEFGAQYGFNLDDLERLVASTDRNKAQRIGQYLSVLASEYDFRPVDVATIPYGQFAVENAQSGTVLHNYGAIQCLERLLDLLDDEAFILVNDYGSADGKDAAQFEHQRYTGSTFVGINFALLKNYFTNVRKCQWLEPAEDDGHIFSRMLGHRIATDTEAIFCERFGKRGFDWRQQPAQMARECRNHGRVEAAATYYRVALERQPKNWMLMDEVARFLTFGFKNPRAGYAMAQAGLRENPTCSADLWTTLGESLVQLGHAEEARRAFLRTLKINGNDVRSRYNLACLLAGEGELDAALKYIAEGLALDKPGAYREGFLRKQSEILGQLQQQYQQECHHMANRVSHLNYSSFGLGPTNVVPAINGKRANASAPATLPEPTFISTAQK